MTKAVLAIFLLLVSFWMCSCASLTQNTNRAGTSAAKTSSQDRTLKELVIVATTDFHAAFDRAESLAQTIRELKAQYGDRMLYLDGGDCFQGTLEGNMNKGRSNIVLYNKLGVDAMAMGNHDLDYGPDVLGRVNPKPDEDGLGNFKARVAESKFKWLSSNFVFKKSQGRKLPKNALGQSTLLAPWAVFERAGGRACVIGATTPATANITNPLFIRGMKFEALSPVIEAEAKRLRTNEHCNWIILVAHAGLLCTADGRCLEDADRAEILQLLKKLPPGTLDAVIAGHTHKRAQEVIAGTPVIEAEHSARVVGVLKLDGKNHTFEPFIELKDKTPNHTATADVTTALKPFRDAANTLKTRVIGQTSNAFIRRYEGENALSNLIADSLLKAGRDAASADFGLMNAGGVRADLPQGQLTYGDLYGVLPFDNSLAVVELTGAELRRTLEIATSGGHGVASVSGLKIKRILALPGQTGSFSRDLNNDGKHEDWERNLILELTDNQGVPINDHKHYRLATIDFLVIGGDHQNNVFDRIPDSRKHLFPGIWVRDLVAERFNLNRKIDPAQYFIPSAPRIESISVN